MPRSGLEGDNPMKLTSAPHLAVAAIAAALLIAVAGCGTGNQLPVRGKVTVDGTSLANGTISFQPAEGTAARSSGTMIRDGNYDIPAARGLPPGKYLVTVQAFKETGRMLSDPQGGKRPEFGPMAFTEKQPMEVTIAAGKDNVFDFTLTGRAAAANPSAEASKR
jgi:hypothetical protein